MTQILMKGHQIHFLANKYESWIKLDVFSANKWKKILIFDLWLKLSSTLDSNLECTLIDVVPYN